MCTHRSGWRLQKNSEGERAAKRAKTSGKKYELVHVRSLRGILQGAVRQAVGPEFVMQDAQVTAMLVVTMLLTGSDYCRKLPRIGPRKLWDSLHVVIPGLLASSKYSSTEGLVIDENRAVDIFYAQVRPLAALCPDKCIPECLTRTHSFSHCVSLSADLTRRLRRRCILWSSRST